MKHFGACHWMNEQNIFQDFGQDFVLEPEGPRLAGGQSVAINAPLIVRGGRWA